MLDANARHVERGTWFFVKVQALSPAFESEGVEKDDLLLVRHEYKTKEERCLDRVITSTYKRSWDDEGFTFLDSLWNDGWFWATYQGCADGKGFVCEETKQKALSLLGGVWLEE